MAHELPIACSLSATDLTERLRLIAELGGDALVDSRLEGAHAHLRFAGGPGVRERIEEIVAAELECCAFLTMAVADEPHSVVLSIDAPADAATVVAELVGAFTGDATAASP